MSIKHTHLQCPPCLPHPSPPDLHQGTQSVTNTTHKQQQKHVYHCPFCPRQSVNESNLDQTILMFFKGGSTSTATVTCQASKIKNRPSRMDTFLDLRYCYASLLLCVCATLGVYVCVSGDGSNSSFHPLGCNSSPPHTTKKDVVPHI